MDSCTNYSSAINKSDTVFLWCGEIGEIIEDYQGIGTSYIEESILKREVEKLFGKGSYNKTESFDINLSSGYIYDDDSSRYVYGSAPKGGIRFGYTTNLISAIKSNNEIILIEKQKVNI